MCKLPSTVRFEDKRKEANNFRKQYLRKVQDSWTVVTNEVSSFEPEELEAIADHMRSLDEDIP